MYKHRNMILSLVLAVAGGALLSGCDDRNYPDETPPRSE